MVAKVVSRDVHSTVVFFKLDRGYSFLEGKIAKIIALIEMTAHYMEIMMVYWVAHCTVAWKARVQFP